VSRDFSEETFSNGEIGTGIESLVRRHVLKGVTSTYDPVNGYYIANLTLDYPASAESISLPNGSISAMDVDLIVSGDSTYVKEKIYILVEKRGGSLNLIEFDTYDQWRFGIYGDLHVDVTGSNPIFTYRAGFQGLKVQVSIKTQQIGDVPILQSFGRNVGIAEMVATPVLQNTFSIVSAIVDGVQYEDGSTLNIYPGDPTYARGTDNVLRLTNITNWINGMLPTTLRFYDNMRSFVCTDPDVDWSVIISYTEQEGVLQTNVWEYRKDPGVAEVLIDNVQASTYDVVDL
jgi:hypothetical protein